MICQQQHRYSLILAHSRTIKVNSMADISVPVVLMRRVTNEGVQRLSF